MTLGQTSQIKSLQNKYWVSLMEEDKTNFAPTPWIDGSDCLFVCPMNLCCTTLYNDHAARCQHRHTL